MTRQGTAARFVVHGLFALVLFGNPRPAAADTPAEVAYGSGNHGAWIVDAFGLPAYRYTGCTDARAPCVPTSDAVHQLGNDGVTALAHSGGYVELYSTRSYHRFANRFDDAAQAYAGGFGWVRDGRETWSTLYADKPADATYARTFGMGYFEKVIEHGDLRLEHQIYMTDGGDAVLREHLVFTNLASTRKTITYFDYWDVAWWHPRILDGSTQASSYDPAAVTTSYDARLRALFATSRASARDASVPDLLVDPVPQVSFVSYLDTAPDAFETVQRAFFGAGTRALPDAVAGGRLRNGRDTSGALANQDAVLATQKSFTLAPGERRALDLAFGLAPRGEERATVAKQLAEPSYALPRIAASWAARIPRVDFGTDAWLGRELAWSYYYLRSGVLREDFFGARVLNQGSIYLYDWGTNSGPRSTFRHLLPFIYTDPELAKESLLYFLRAMKPNGEMPYSTAGHGAWNTQGMTPSDHTFWLLSAALEYVNATRDRAFLDARFDYWCATGKGQCGSGTVYEGLTAAYLYQKYGVSTGEHGLVRLLHSDWDDFLVLLATDPVSTATRGESTMNSALSLWTYPAFADLAARRGDAWLSASLRADIAALTTATRAQWRMDHMNRGYTFAAPDAGVELGARSVWIASNGIALLAPGLLDQTESHALAQRIEHENVDPSPVGLAAIGSTTYENGTPGAWYSLAGPTIEGLLGHDERALAWRIFLRQTLANHATQYPHYWYGVFSGPDMYFTPLEEAARLGVGGTTWCYPSICMAKLPVTNMFAHSEPLLASLRMAGLRVDADGFTIDPGVPSATFSWASPTYGVAYGYAAAAGWTRAVATDVVTTRVRLPRGLATAHGALVNGRFVPVTRDPLAPDFVSFALPLDAGETSYWALF